MTLATIALVAYNYCTLSYTTAYWGKEEWAKELDRLAEHKFTAALVLDGAEKVWRDTLKDLGYPKARIDSFIADPAARAWWLMGNLEGLGAPVADAEIENKATLGRWLFAEMRKRGIEPIVQGFNGIVPSGTKGAIEQGKWCNIYQRPAVLSPLSSDFDKFASAWYKNLAKVYGYDAKNPPKYLAGDLMHEGGGGFKESDLAKIARKVQSSQAKYCGDSVKWVLQSWQGTPPQGILDGLDPKRTLIEFLDKNMSRTGPCGAKYINRTTGEAIPWVWCEVLNFGGNPGLYGGAKRFHSLDAIRKEPSCVGFGMFSEGLFTNEAMYELFLEAATHEGEIKNFYERFAKKRYGYCDENLKKGFQILEDTVWNCPRLQEGAVENIICASPSFELTSVSTWGPKTGIYYDPNKLVEARALFTKAEKKNPTLKKNAAFLYDCAEMDAQIAGNELRALLPKCKEDKAAQEEFLAIIERTLKTLEASPWSHLPYKEKPYWRMITNWTGDDESAVKSGLNNYAHRLYPELIRDYYLPRWRRLFGYTKQSEDKTSSINSIADLKGRRCGVVTGTAIQGIIEELQSGVEFCAFNDYPSLMAAFRLGKVDAIPMDTIVILRWIANFPDEFKIAESFGTNPYGYIFPKSSPLKALVNAEIKKLKESGKLESIISKWCNSQDMSSIEVEPYPHRQDFTGKNGTIRFASTSDYEPGAFIRNGEFVGFDIDIVKWIACELDMNVEIFPIMDGALVPSVQGNKADMGGGCLTITAERAKAVDFSNCYMDTGFSLMVKKNVEEQDENSRTNVFSSLKDSFVRTFVHEKRWQLLLEGLGVTLLITILSSILGTILAFPVWLARISKVRIITNLAKAYITILQGTPVLVLLMILFYIVFGTVNIDGIWIAIFGFGINLSAYAGEMLRSGVASVPVGQREAALALGYSPRQAFFKFVLPQAVRAILPVYRGELIGLLKMTSVVGYIAIVDLTKTSDLIRSRTYESFFPILSTALIYFIVSYLMAFLLERLGRHLDPK